MTADDLVKAALAIHGTSFSLSIAALYAVLGDKFLRPILERAEGTCARLRGELTRELVQSIEPFAASSKFPAVTTVLLDADGNRLEAAQITNAVSMHSESFNQAFRTFLDTESADFNRYWIAFKLRTRLKHRSNNLRVIVSIWPSVGLVTLFVFSLFSYGILPLPSMFWLCVFGCIGLIPPVGLLLLFPVVAFASCYLDSLEV